MGVAAAIGASAVITTGVGAYEASETRSAAKKSAQDLQDQQNALDTAAQTKINQDTANQAQIASSAAARTSQITKQGATLDPGVLGTTPLGAVSTPGPAKTLLGS